MKIPFNRPFLTGTEFACIKDALSLGHLSGNGKFTQMCHEWLQKRHSLGKALLTHSGTAALEMAALLLDIKPGDEIIMPSYTFVSTANAFVLRGGIPVFVDVCNDTMNIDPVEVEKALTSKTRAIVAVHYAGVLCNMDHLSEIASVNCVPLIEDAAQAILASYNGKMAGSFGSLAAFSFHETKNCISGEGGALAINDASLYDRAQILWEKGTNRTQFVNGLVDKYSWVDIGSSFLPSELTAAFLWAQLQEADKITANRIKFVSMYRERLAPLEQKGFFRLPCYPDGVIQNGHMSYIILNNHETRTQLLDYLRKSGVEAVFHYVPLHSSRAGLRFGKTCGKLTNTDNLSSRLLRLPLFNGMTEEELNYVCSKIYRFFIR